MKTLRGLWKDWDSQSSTALTVGVLDGVHTGHRFLIDRLLRSELGATVVTFDPHPVEILSPGTHPRLLTDLDERVALLAEAGVDVTAILDLGEIRDLSPEEFVGEILVGKLGARRVVAGVDFQFGKNRAGNVALLGEMGSELGFEVEVLDLVVDDGTVSSSRIRGLIEHGRVDEAAQLLGSRYRMTNTVVEGDRRGRAIGFPTANLNPPERKVLPADGIYAAYAHVGNETHGAAVNVGIRPTFGGGARIIEPYLLDFDREIYGEEVTVEFVERLRDELKFDSVDDLTARMHDDVERTRGILAAAEANVG